MSRFRLVSNSKSSSKFGVILQIFHWIILLFIMYFGCYLFSLVCSLWCFSYLPLPFLQEIWIYLQFLSGTLFRGFFWEHFLSCGICCMLPWDSSLVSLMGDIASEAVGIGFSPEVDEGWPGDLQDLCSDLLLLSFLSLVSIFSSASNLFLVKILDLNWVVFCLTNDSLLDYWTGIHFCNIFTLFHNDD